MPLHFLQGQGTRSALFDMNYLHSEVSKVGLDIDMTHAVLWTCDSESRLANVDVDDKL